MQQPTLDLFRVPLRDPRREPVRSAPYAKGSETSRAGAEAVQGQLTRQCAALLALYRDKGPLTDAEAAELLHWERSTVIPRRTQLQRDKLVGKAGVRKNRKSQVENTLWGIL